MRLSKAGTGPKLSSIYNWLAGNDLGRASRTRGGVRAQEFCKTSGRTPCKKRLGGPDIQRPHRPIQSSEAVAKAYRRLAFAGVGG